MLTGLGIRVLVTDFVHREVLWNASRLPGCVDVVDLDDFLTWGRRVGMQDRHHAGEASTFSVATTIGAIAIVDDGEARRVGKRLWPDTHGTLWLVAAFVNHGVLDKVSASSLVDALRGSGMRLPGNRGSFVSWAKARGLLEEE